MSTRHATVLISTVVLALTGCGSDGSADSGTPTPGNTGAVGSDFGSQLGSAVNKASADLAKSYSEQAKQQQTQLDTIKASAKGYGDQQLDGAIQQIEKVLSQLSGKIDEIKNADEGSAAALQKEIQKLMGQSNDLFKQAQTRLAQLQKS